MAKDTVVDRLEPGGDPRVSHAPHTTEADKGKERANALSILHTTNTQVLHSPPNLPHSKELAPLRARRRVVSKRDRTPRVRDEARLSIDKSGIWNISKPSHCISLRLPDEGGVRVTGLLYSNSGGEILALRGDGTHHIWQWPKQKDGSFSKATASVLPNLYKPRGNPSMKNDMRDTDPCNSIASIALSKNDSYILSTSGGAVSLFIKEKFKSMAILVPPPPTSTCIAFDPEDSNIVAIGMDDCSILIYDFGVLKFAAKIIGHHERITSLAFSSTLKVLLSSALDGEIIVWGRDGWGKKTSKHLQIPGVAAASIGDTRLHLHKDQKQLLVIHSDHLLVLEVPGLNCMMQWHPLKANGSITNAAYSCDGQQIYVTLDGGTIFILTASSLTTRCRISISAYMALCSSPPYPVMVCAHSSEPNQFAFGLTDGRVFVIEPTESAGIWPESVSAPSTSVTEHKEQAVDLWDKKRRPDLSEVIHRLERKRWEQAADSPSPVVHRLDKKRLPESNEMIHRLHKKRLPELSEMNEVEQAIVQLPSGELDGKRLHELSKMMNVQQEVGPSPSIELLEKKLCGSTEVEQDGERILNPSVKLEEERPPVLIEKIEVQQHGEANPSVKLEEKRLPELSEMTEVEKAIVQLPSGELDGKRLHELSKMMNVQQEVGPSLSIELLEKKLFGSTEMIEVDQDGERIPSGELDGKRLHELSKMMNVQQEVGPSPSIELLEKKLFGSTEMIEVDQDGERIPSGVGRKEAA